MIKIIQVTDPHLTKDKNTEIRACKTYSSFKRVIHWIDRNEKPNFILVSGDISDDGSIESYLLYKNKIESLNKPFFSILGNHDNHDNFKLIFQNNFPIIQSIPLSDEWVLIVLDSTVTGKEGGALINNQLIKIRKLIEINSHKNLIFCLHHHPIEMGFWIDEIGLQNKDQFLSLILDKPNVKAVVWGHVHHESETTLGSIQFLSTPSTCYQFQENKQSMSKNKPGYRKINLFKSGRLTTSVVRVD